MRFQRLGAVLVATGFVVGCSSRSVLAPTAVYSPSPKGTWKVIAAGAPKSASASLWSGCRLILDKRGRFHAYGVIDASGFASESPDHIDLTVSTLLGAGVADWRNTIARYPYLKGLRLDTPISLQVKGDHLLSKSDCLAFDGVEFERYRPESVDALVKLLWSTKPGENGFAFDQIVEQGEEAVPALVTAFSDPALHDKRSMVAALLGYSKLPLARAALVRGLYDSWMPVRSLSLIALGRSGAVEAISEIEKGVDDKRLMAFEAAQTLGQLHDPSATPWLIRRLEMPMDSREDYLVSDLIMALAACRDARALSTIRKFENDPRARVKAAVAVATFTLDPKHFDRRRFLPLLESTLSDSNWIAREQGLRALARLGDMDSIPAISNCLDHPDASTRMEALNALVILRAPSARAEANRQLSDPISAVRQNAVSALRRVGVE